MDPNVEGAILCAGVVVSLASTMGLAAALFGACPSCSTDTCCRACRLDPDEEDKRRKGILSPDEEPWCCTLALRWMCYKCCCCCGNGLRLREWIQDDLKRMENAEKLISE